jgi:Fe-S-cluster-containing dehydrogenase component
MVPNQNNRVETYNPAQSTKPFLLAQPKVVACDLCDSEGTKETPEPRCVSSCPHEAAARYNGDELLQRVLAGNSKKK